MSASTQSTHAHTACVLWLVIRVWVMVWITCIFRHVHYCCAAVLYLVELGLDAHVQSCTHARLCWMLLFFLWVLRATGTVLTLVRHVGCVYIHGVSWTVKSWRKRIPIILEDACQTANCEYIRGDIFPFRSMWSTLKGNTGCTSMKTTPTLSNLSTVVTAALPAGSTWQTHTSLLDTFCREKCVCS